MKSKESRTTVARLGVWHTRPVAVQWCSVTLSAARDQQDPKEGAGVSEVHSTMQAQELSVCQKQTVFHGLSFHTDFTDVQAVGMVRHLGIQEQVLQQHLPKTT